MRAEIYGCFAEDLPPYNGTLTITYLRERERGRGSRDEEIKERGEKIKNQQGINCELSYITFIGC